MRRTKEEAMKTRESVLRAAAQIIVRLGVSAFTIDAVAQESGVTKGGVLHHFPSKEALIDGLIDQVTETFTSRIEAELATEPVEQPGRWHRAYIRMVFSVQDDEINLIPALAAAVVANPQTIERIRHSMGKTQMDALQDNIDPITATIIRLAVEGFLFTRAFNVNVLDNDARQSVYEGLLRLTAPINLKS